MLRYTQDITRRISDRGEPARAIGRGSLKNFSSKAAHCIEGFVNALDVDPGEDAPCGDRRSVLDPLPDETGGLEAGVWSLDSPSKDFFVELRRLRHAEGGDLQIADLAMLKIARGFLFAVRRHWKCTPIFEFVVE
jgi:hypothetical protein